MPVCFYVVEGHLSENATKIWLLKNDTFRIANNNSQVLPEMLRHILAPTHYPGGGCFSETING